MKTWRGKAAAALERASAKAQHTIISAWRAHVARDTTAIGVLLDLAAAVCFSIAAGMLALPAGIAVAGVCCVVMNARLSTEG